VFLLPVILKLRGKSKVTNLEVHFSIDQQVAELQVSVDHTVAMQVLHCHDQVVHVEQGLRFAQTPTRTAAHILIQCLVWAHLQDNEDIISILEMVMKLDHVLMI
jgi:hypothetical protein